MTSYITENQSNGYIASGAWISGCDRYRYSLWRKWGDGRVMVFCGLNPSTADAHDDDPTIRRCVGFAKDNGYDSMVMVNLFALRATEPKEMMKAADPIGHVNNSVILHNSRKSSMFVAAWGVHGDYKNRQSDVIQILENNRIPVYCLGKTKHGFPRHPLYVRKDKEFELYG